MSHVAWMSIDQQEREGSPTALTGDPTMIAVEPRPTGRSPTPWCCSSNLLFDWVTLMEPQYDPWATRPKDHL
jgi:hypothetical protein